jgi:hypothetical protein
MFSLWVIYINLSGCLKIKNNHKYGHNHFQAALLIIFYF